MLSSRISTRTGLLAVASIAMLMLAASAQAQQAKEIRITYKGRQFQPAEISAPANTPLTLRVKNLDADAMEFESTSLRVEKVIPASGEGTLSLRALAPGRYEFFDDFNQKSQGALNVK